VRLGLRTRATSTARVGARRLIADGLCVAAVWLMTLDVSTLVTQRARGMHDPLLAPTPLALLVAALALALIGRDRLAGAAALAWTALRMPSSGTTIQASSTSLPSCCRSSASASWSWLRGDGRPIFGGWAG
jgi:hypothetical protein